jgi:type II pantothenate kinase
LGAVNEDRLSGNEKTLGVDAGASLVKLAIASPSDDLQLERHPATDLGAVAKRIAQLQADRICLTGGGAAALQPFLDATTTVHDEFESWAAGARRAVWSEPNAPREPFLLVSLGTGTSVQRVEESSAARVGGTALGGGTLVGLGRALSGASGFTEACELAARGSRAAVDLLVSDVFEGGEAPLDGTMTASNFGKLGRPDADVAAADLLAGLVNLIAENISLIVGGLAHATSTQRVFIGGSTIQGNPALEERLMTLLGAFGCEVHVLANGEYTGAIGAITLPRAVNPTA